jgi:tRNA U34 5-carboxymethylaminomethyl modifying GTPase MnmE/TrmE/uncharacterized tellurite resistance protein B-like protein
MLTAVTPSVDRTKIAQLLSRLIGQDIQSEQASKLLVFAGALSAVLVGVTCADQQVSDEEKVRLQGILNDFVPKSSPLRSLFELMFKGVRQYQLHNKSQALGILLGDLMDSEMLLLLGLGYELATADGVIDPAEEEYLQQLAQDQGIDLALTAVIRDGLMEAAMIDGDALAEVRCLLDPVRFQHLDPVFSRAAERMLEDLLKVDQTVSEQSVSITYGELEKFQTQRQNLKGLCAELEGLLAESCDQLSLPDSVMEGLAKIQAKLDSQRFRVAIVGEFSQGKSTLLNALLGEEIQPVRAIPCSGTVTVLRHGEKQRVIARYRDGREEEIPFEQYQERAAISEDAALSNREEALASDLVELVLEHPGLELCRQGVELVDSPGLNEHPERSDVTRQLLKNVDAVIFLANASRPLTQGERELLQELRAKLNAGNSDAPAENLFVVVNFMDLLRREKDQQQVQQLFKNFLLSENALISSPDRLHFISAQAALDAILDGNTEDIYWVGLKKMTQSLESFLTSDRSGFQTRSYQTSIENVCAAFQSHLSDARSSLNAAVALSETEKKQLLEQIGEFAGHSKKLQLLIEALQNQALNETQEKWNHYFKQIKSSVEESSQVWTATENDGDKIASLFARQMEKDVDSAIQSIRQTIYEESIQPKVVIIEQQVSLRLADLKTTLADIDQLYTTQTVKQCTLNKSRYSESLTMKSNGLAEEHAGENMLGKGGMGIAVGTGLAVVSAGITLFPAVIVGGLIGAAFGLFQKPDPIAIKKKTLMTGLQSLDATQNLILEGLSADLTAIFEDDKAEIVSLLDVAIESLNSLLQKREAAVQLSVESRSEQSSTIEQWSFHLDSITNQI